MTNREATATIKGYHYQFDKTILEILSAGPDEQIVVEGLEDVDLESPTRLQSIQCKYLEAQKRSDSKLRDPVVLMIKHFVSLPSGSKEIGYTLYCHFGKPSTAASSSTPTLSELQKMLRWKQRKPIPKDRDLQSENNWTDAQLVDFLDCFKIEEGPSFEEQQSRLHDLMASVYGVSSPEVRLHYYSNALSEIVELAGTKDKKFRTLTKQKFIAATKKSHLLFSLWYQRFLDQSNWLKEQKRWLKTRSALGPAQERVLFLDTDSCSIEDPQFDLAAFLRTLVEKHFDIGRATQRTRPWTVVLKIPPTTLTETKKSLLRRGIVFNDGMEHIEFQPELFLAPPVIEVERKKIKRASYALRLISLDSFARVQWREPLDTILFVSRNLEPDDHFARSTGCKVDHLAYIETLTALAQLLN